MTRIARMRATGNCDDIAERCMELKFENVGAT